jgi:DNA-directed RNA polymerase subunit RPC12/RpoP
MSIEQVGILQLVIILVVWLICAAVAWTLAPDRDMTFFLVTLLILGPLGVAAALIAQPRDPEPAAPPRRPVAAGRRRFICPRCGAENDIPESDRSYGCWRCSEHRTVQAATKETKPAKTAPAGAEST